MRMNVGFTGTQSGMTASTSETGRTAAREIRRRGLAALHGEGVAVRHPMNRETARRAAA